MGKFQITLSLKQFSSKRFAALSASSLHNGFAVIAGGAASWPRLEGWAAGEIGACMVRASSP
jgi:hypothetical protein